MGSHLKRKKKKDMKNFVMFFFFEKRFDLNETTVNLLLFVYGMAWPELANMLVYFGMISLFRTNSFTLMLFKSKYGLFAHRFQHAFHITFFTRSNYEYQEDALFFFFKCFSQVYFRARCYSINCSIIQVAHTIDIHIYIFLYASISI